MRMSSLRSWRALACLACTLVGGVIAGRVWADGIPDAPGTLYYSGYVEDDTGPLDGPTDFRVLVWPAASGGVTPVCQTGTTPVEAVVDDGHFRLPLPPECVDAVHASPNLWVEVIVAGETLPRQHLGAVPYAVEAEHAVTATTADALAAPVRVTITSGSYTGRVTDGALVGYAAVRSICQRETGSPTGHMCYGSELARARQSGLAVPDGAKYAPEVRYLYNTAVSHDVGDCGGWTSATTTCGGSGAQCYQALWHDSPAGCGDTRPMLCCD